MASMAFLAPSALPGRNSRRSHFIPAFPPRWTAGATAWLLRAPLAVMLLNGKAVAAEPCSGSHPSASANGLRSYGLHNTPAFRPYDAKGHLLSKGPEYDMEHLIGMEGFSIACKRK